MQATIDKPARRGRPIDLSNPDRLPPHSIEAEQGILGCIMLDPMAIHECYDKLKLPDVFYDLRHAALFSVMSDLMEAHKPIDPITLLNELRNRNQLEALGGMAYLSALADSTPSAANINYYVAIAREKYLLRKIIQTCTEAVNRAYENIGTPDELLHDTEAAVLSIGKTHGDDDDEEINTIVRKAMGEIEAEASAKDEPCGIPTGYYDLDKKLRGLKDGEVTVIAARPSCGKTSLAMNIAEYVSIQCGHHVAVFSLEMSSVSLIKRMISSRARVNLREVRDDLVSHDLTKLTTASCDIAKSKLHIIDRSVSVKRLKAKARRLHQQYGLRLIVIDYMGLMETSPRPGQNRQEQISEISSGVKQLAKELKLPVVMLSQLNRDIEKDKARKPRLSDLRESGAVEQDADVAILLYPKQSEGQDEDKEIVRVGAIVAKQRNGPTGEVGLTFFKCYTRLESEARVQDD